MIEMTNTQYNIIGFLLVLHSLSLLLFQYGIRVCTKQKQCLYGKYMHCFCIVQALNEEGMGWHCSDVLIVLLIKCMLYVDLH
jgi:hypothetical protein